MAQDKPRFIRKNGKVIPVGGKQKSGDNKTKKKPESKIGKSQSKSTVKRRLGGLKKEQGSVFKAAVVGGLLGTATGILIHPSLRKLGLNVDKGTVAGVLAGVGAVSQSRKKRKGNQKRAEKINALNKRLQEF